MVRPPWWILCWCWWRCSWYVPQTTIKSYATDINNSNRGVGPLFLGLAQNGSRRGYLLKRRTNLITWNICKISNKKHVLDQNVIEYCFRWWLTQCRRNIFICILRIDEFILCQIHICVTAIQSSVITWVVTGFHSLDKSQLLALQLQQLTTARENFDKEGWQEIIQQVSLFLPFSSAAANVGPLASAKMLTKAQV